MDTQNLIEALEYYYLPEFKKEAVSSLADSSKEREFRKGMERELAIWWKEQKENDRFQDALGRLSKLENKRRPEDFLVFKSLVIVGCFLACMAYKKLLDTNKKMRDKLKAARENLATQRKHLKKLIELIGENKNSPFYFVGDFYVSRQDLTEFEGELLNVHEESSGKLLLTSVLYEDLLKRRCERIDQILNDGKYMGFDRYIIIFNKNGALFYPQCVPKQAQKQDHYMNSLMFNLVFLFRLYTGMARNPWLLEIKGPLPQSGKSYYDLLEKLINATFEGKINEKGSKDELDAKNIEERVRRWINQKVEFGSWFFSYT